MTSICKAAAVLGARQNAQRPYITIYIYTYYYIYIYITIYIYIIIILLYI